ncbi:hypothetical protein LTR15_008148 [Elasticomyces elasticus]|nr:hypothetical protein LTR15_008148 [Elasticomyces elasticus]
MTSIAGAKRQDQIDPIKSAKVQRRRGAQRKDVAATRRPEDVNKTINSRPGTTQSRPAETAMPVAKHVFGTGELFDEILKHVDMKTLLLSQRVSRSWKTSIASSSLMQQKLFLKPAKLEYALILADGYNQAKLFIHATSKFSDPEAVVSLLNPLLFNQPQRFPEGEKAEILLRAEDGVSGFEISNYGYINPSWKGMYLWNDCYEGPFAGYLDAGLLYPGYHEEWWTSDYGHSFSDGVAEFGNWLMNKGSEGFDKGRGWIDWRGVRVYVKGQFKSVAEYRAEQRKAEEDEATDSSSDDDDEEESELESEEDEEPVKGEPDDEAEDESDQSTVEEE